MKAECSKILVVARWPVGGIRTYFRYIYSQNIFFNFEFTFLMPNSGKISQYLQEYCPDLKFRFVNSGDSSKTLFFAAAKELRSNHYNLVHSHGYSAGFLCAVALAGVVKTKHLMTAHDVFLASQFSGVKGWGKQRLMSLGFRRLDMIHAVSHDCSSNFSEFFPSVSRDKIEVVCHGIDVERFSNHRTLQLIDDMRQEDSYFIGFFGRFMGQKGFRYLVDAIGKIVSERPELRDRIKVLTFGGGGFVREEFQAIEVQGLKDLFVQMPHTDDMPSALNSVDLVAMPSLWEACGLLGMEALVAGVPIVGTSCIGLREVLEGSPAYVVEPRDSQALVDVILGDMNKPKKEAFQAYAKTLGDRFSHRHAGDGLDVLYQKLLN